MRSKGRGPEEPGRWTDAAVTSDLGTNEPVEAIGVNLAERVYAGLVVGHKIQATLLSFLG